MIITVIEIQLERAGFPPGAVPQQFQAALERNMAKDARKAPSLKDITSAGELVSDALGIRFVLDTSRDGAARLAFGPLDMDTESLCAALQRAVEAPPNRQ